MPLFPARNSLRERYAAEADRVLTDYREASESTPVYLSDWQRANRALTAAIGFAPEDKTLRGKSKVVLGYINLFNRDPATKKAAPLLRTAREDFEEARALLPHSPDPHLGLAQIYMHDGDLEQAESELNEAQRNGFTPRRREQKDLADTYRRRGERFLATAERSRDVGQKQDALQKADSDLSHALTLYNAIAPMPYGAEMAERVLNEREQAQRTLEASRLVSDGGPKENP
jgi:tetratricopeptide (TPR) repeat protein